MAYRLSIELGERIERCNLAEGEHVVGSHPGCGVAISHPTVSRRHARITVSPESVLVEDLGSRTGTWLAGERLTGPAAIAPGSRLQIGTVPDWPGNVRQLQREMARCALFLEDGRLLESGHLDEEIRRGSAPRRGLRERLEEFERQEIRQALAAAGMDVSAAAAELGIGRSTLYRRMLELGIERSAAAPASIRRKQLTDP